MENKNSVVNVENKIPPNGKKKRFSTIIGAMKGWYTNARLVPYITVIIPTAVFNVYFHFKVFSKLNYFFKILLTYYLTISK